MYDFSPNLQNFYKEKMLLGQKYQQVRSENAFSSVTREIFQSYSGFRIKEENTVTGRIVVVDNQWNGPSLAKDVTIEVKE